MKYPDFLREGQTIGFVAPSFAPTIFPYEDLFEETKSFFLNKGYKVLEGPNCKKSDGFGISSSPKSCGEELTSFYLSDECNILISSGGGELMCETMDYVDFDKLSNSKPKWFMGYSDNTNFTFLLNILCDTASVYGPCACEFGTKPVHKAVIDALQALKGKLKFSSYDFWEKEKIKDLSNPYQGPNCTEKSILKAYYGKNAALDISFNGRLLGGCIDVITNICGTKYDKVKDFLKRYQDDGFIWFLECCDLNPMDFRRTLWKFKNAGYFENTKGFLFGRPRLIDNEYMGMNYEQAILDVLGDLNLPMVLNADIGHLPPSMPIISGSIGNVMFNGELNIEYILE